MTTASRIGTLPDAASKVESAREAVSNAVDTLIQQLESGKSEQLLSYLSTVAKFHKYSFGNVMLIMGQCPDASRVAGFRTWKTMDRNVKRGEKGIVIIAPMIFRDKDAKKKPRQLEDDDTIVRFRAVYVFDVSQTEGEPLPEPDRIDGDPGLHLAKLESAIESHGIALHTVESLNGADGTSSGGTIKIVDSLSDAERFSVLVHEWAHELLHQGKLIDKAARPPKVVRETEAEAVAFVVSHSVGLDTKSASSDYIQLYDGNKETLVASLDRIQKTACTIIEAINDHDGNDGPSPSRNDNTPKPPIPPVAKHEIEVHELEPDRFAPGEFCYRQERTVGEGDVVSSYSADKIAFDDTVRNPFTWKGQQWIMTSGKGNGIQAYRLVHPESFPRTPTTYAKRTRDDGGESARHDPNGFYDGMTVTRGKQTYILCGPPVKLMPGKAAQTSMFDDNASLETQAALIESRQLVR